MTIEQILLSLPGIVGLLATLVKIIADWKKGKAETTGIITDAAADVILILRQELQSQHDKIALLQASEKNLRARVSRLEQQVRDFGGEPVT